MKEKISTFIASICVVIQVIGIVVAIGSVLDLGFAFLGLKSIIWERGVSSLLVSVLMTTVGYFGPIVLKK
jgi:hypothetical protein